MFVDVTAALEMGFERF